MEVDRFIEDLKIRNSVFSNTIGLGTAQMKIYNETGSAARRFSEQVAIQGLTQRNHLDSYFAEVEKHRTLLKSLQTPTFSIPLSISNQLNEMIEQLQPKNSILAQISKLTQFEDFYKLKTRDLDLSVPGMSGISEIANTMRLLRPFEAEETFQLRINLGDWRTLRSLNVADLLDQNVRSELYLSRGLNPKFREIPSAEFYDATSKSGLRSAPFHYRNEEDDQENEFSISTTELNRANAAHKGLYFFEIRIRKFVSKKMSVAFGPDWQRHRLPSDMLRQWLSKRGKSGNEDIDPIDFADFTDYLKIILRKDNWKEVFGTTFGRITDVQESFQRLFPVRLCIMHARPITQEDELLMIVETGRLLGVIEFG